MIYSRLGVPVVARWHAGTVFVQVGAGAEIAAFSLVDESPLELTEAPNGDWYLLYYSDAENTVVRRRSRDGGVTWVVV